MTETSPKRQKTLWEKEKLLAPFPTVFSKRFVLQTCKNQALSGKGLTLYHINSTFNDPEKQAS